MRILFLSDNFPPEVNAPATRTWEHCREWVKAGAQVTVITCAPNFPQGRVYPGYRNRLYRRERVEGIDVVRVWTYVTANEGFLKRTLDYVSFAAGATAAGLFEKADVIVATSPQFFTTFAGFALSKLKRRPWVFELRDLWPESIRTVGAMRQGRLLRLLGRIELFMYRDADLIVALTGAFRNNLVGRGIPASKIAVVTNGANLELFGRRDKDPALLTELGLQGKFVLAYVGTHGLAHGLEFIVAALGKLDDERVHALFVGDGARKKDAVAAARRLGLRNATFVDPVPKERVPAYLSLADAVLVPLIKAETFKAVIPSKIFEAAAMGKPILLGVEGQARELVEGYGAGLCFEPGNEADFLAQLALLERDNELHRRLQEGCARLAADFDRRRLAAEMRRLLLELKK